MIKRKIKTLVNIIRIRLKEKTYEGRMKYLLFKKNSDRLLIVFSAFPPSNLRLYNYVKGFASIDVDRLYINDNFGYKGSYYLYENGTTYPFDLTNGLINKIVSGGGYKYIYTTGTSKGGTAAIIFGLIFNAHDIFAGACQYNLGTYLNKEAHRKILISMMGSASETNVHLLDEYMPQLIERYHHSNSVIHLIYSKKEKEKTYEEEIVDLVEQLKKYDIQCVQKIENFTNHNDVGRYFLPYVQDFFINTNTNG